MKFVTHIFKLPHIKSKIDFNLTSGKLKLFLKLFTRNSFYIFKMRLGRPQIVVEKQNNKRLLHDWTRTQII